MNNSRQEYIPKVAANIDLCRMNGRLVCIKESILPPYCDISNPRSVLCKAAPECPIAVRMLLGTIWENTGDDLMHLGDSVMATQVYGMGNRQRSFEKERDLLAPV